MSGNMRSSNRYMDPPDRKEYFQDRLLELS